MAAARPTSCACRPRSPPLGKRSPGPSRSAKASTGRRSRHDTGRPALDAVLTDPYAVLGIERDAGPEQVKRAFRRQAKRHHPDLHPGPDAAARMAGINRAYELLTDPVRRAAWDVAHPSSRRTGATAPAAPAPRDSSLDAARAFVLTFGKHRGRTLGQVEAVEPGYIAWMARALTNRPEVLRHARVVLAHLESTGWRDTPRPPREHRPSWGAGRPATSRPRTAPTPTGGGRPAGVVGGQGNAPPKPGWLVGLGLAALIVVAWVIGLPRGGIAYVLFVVVLLALGW